MSNISVIYGNEDFLIEQHLKNLIAQALGPDGQQNPYAREVLEGENATITNIINACQSLGMFSQDKVVIVKDFYLLNAKSDREPGEKEEFEIENLQSALKSLDPGTRLVFVNYGNVDNRKKFAKFLKSIGEFSEYKTFASWEADKVIDWIKKQARIYGKTLDERALFLLHTTVGENLRMLDSELQKIITYSGDAAHISIEDVENMVSSGGASSFMLLDRLIEGKSAKAMELLHAVLYHGEEPIKLLGLLVSHFRGLLMIKSLSAQNLPQPEIAKLSGKHPFVVKNTIASIKNITIRQLIDIMNLLTTADLNVKTGQLKPDVCLELLCQDILAITHKK